MKVALPGEAKHGIRKIVPVSAASTDSDNFVILTVFRNGSAMLNSISTHH